jgi:FAD/FMN-containing dehydrogenase
MTDMLIPSPSVSAPHFREGLIVGPGDADWDQARQAWNLAVDQQPVAVALPRTAAEIVAVVRLAREQGLRVSAQGTGHNAAPLGPLDDVVLIKTHEMRGVTIDAAAQICRAEAGALWMDVVGPAAEHGLAALHGSSPDVGVVGYTLGGGVSWYSRRYGLAASRVLAVELVTAEGELVRATRDHYADLFFAVRGGGGSFGIVTAIEFELIAVGPIHSGHFWFPIERAREVFHAWRAWAPTLPDEVSTSVRHMSIPDVPDAPAELRGKSFAIVMVCSLGDQAFTDAAVAPIRALGAAMDTMAPTEPQDLVHLAMDPPGPVPAAVDHAILGSFEEDTVETLVSTMEAEPSLFMAYVLLGGGASARKLADGATTAIDAPYSVVFGGMAPTPEIGAAARAAVGRVQAALAPWANGRKYLNFAESAADPGRSWDAETYARLREIKGAVDPDGAIVANHTIPAL